MGTRSEVIKYISDFSEVPSDQLNDGTDIVSDIDWSTRHEDERLDCLLEGFVSHFKIYMPSQSFNNFVKENNILKILYPFYYLLFVFKYRNPIEVKHLTIKEMIDIVDKGVWAVSSKSR
ncbi:hypothetical protein ACL7TT_01500 [Microbulbifer sp. 2304DJ12-6]|uniref:hypothetical protein n=1 Tax=Microbulbifer sp. 2304DJ12-6 TaxID=3233340 RepID=UPI0039AF4DA1